jgi:hypothetical protein
VEGPVDEVIIRRVLESLGIGLGPVYGKRGKEHLKAQIGAYNWAAQHNDWLVLVDLDDEEECAPALQRNWLLAPSPRMCFRVAVREIEVWLMADRERLATFLSVSEAVIPGNPEAESDPKRCLIAIAQRSRLRGIREDMVPRPESGRKVGPAYASRLIEFATSSDGWRPDVASQNSDSLSRCMRDLRRRFGILP